MTYLKKLLVLPLMVATSSVFAQQVDTFNIHTQTSTYIDGRPDMLISDGSNIYFAATDYNYGRELWTMKAGANFPTRLSDVQSGKKTSMAGGIKNTCLKGNTIYFAAQDNSHDLELWSYSIGNGAVQRVADVYKGTTGSVPNYITAMGEEIYFAARSVDIGNELWAHDPVNNTTYLVNDINSGAGDGNPRDLFAFNGKLFFGADNGTAGNEPHVYDPGTQTVSMIADLIPGSGGGFFGNFVTMSGKLYFTAREPNYGLELYQYNGTTTAPTRLTDLAPGSSDGIYGHSNSIVFNGKIYFDGYDTATQQHHLCGFDPATKTIQILKTNTNGSSVVGEQVIYNNKLFFTATDGTHGVELWSYDGINPPTMVADVVAGPTASNPNNLTVADGYLYFAADLGGTIGEELLRYKDQQLSIENLTQGTGISIYPNPSNGSFNVKLDYTDLKEGSLSVTDMMGRVVHQQPIQNGDKNISLTIPTPSAGVYHLSVTMDGRVTTQNILIK